MATWSVSVAQQPFQQQPPPPQQPDSLDGTIERDTTPFTWHQNPRVASIASMILPGAGQFYNKKYWKIPIVVGGLGTLMYYLIQNNKEYGIYKVAYNTWESIGDSAFRYNWALKNYTSSQLWQYPPANISTNLSNLRDYYRQNRDLCIIMFSLVYLLNIVDASVDAHLAQFDISDNLSLNVKPSILRGSSAGLTVELHFWNNKTYHPNRRYLSSSQ